MGNEDMGGGLYCVVRAVSTNDVLSCSIAKSKYSPLSIFCCSWVGTGTGSCWECSVVAVAVVAAVEAAFAGATAIEVVLVAAVAVAVVSEAVLVWLHQWLSLLLWLHHWLALLWLSLLNMGMQLGLRLNRGQCDIN